MANKRARSKGQVRNLYQYKDMSDADFDTLWEEMQYSSRLSKAFEDRINKKIEEFGKDYDIDDLKINDKETLRAFVQALISLEDYERLIYNMRSEDEVSQANINVIDRISKIMSDLRKDISRLQEDLNITRKIRKSDKESSVVSYITGLKEQARQYYESKMSYVFCDKCNTLLGNVWALYPEEHNKVTFKCARTLADGSKCGNVVTITTKELQEKRGTNKESITPDSLL